jgi:hypothetical protein
MMGAFWTFIRRCQTPLEVNILDDEHLYYLMGWDSLLQFFYDSEENAFYVCDQFGKRVINIFKALTPNDILLFKQDPGYNVFPHRDNRRILCEILDAYQ